MGVGSSAENRATLAGTFVAEKTHNKNCQQYTLVNRKGGDREEQKGQGRGSSCKVIHPSNPLTTKTMITP